MKRSVLLYSVIFLLMLVFSRAVFEINPFGVGFFMALSLLDFNVFLLSPMLIISEYLFNFDNSVLLAAVICSAVHAVYYAFFRGHGRLYPLFAALSLVGYGFYSLKNGTAIELALTLFLIPFFAFICYVFIKPLKLHRLRYKLLDTELVCGSVMLVALGLGLAGTVIYGFSPMGAALVAFVCIAGKCVNSSAALITGISLGLGGAVYGYSPELLGLYCFVTVIVILFLPAPRLLSAPAAAAAYSIFAFYFDVYALDALLPLISVFVGGVVYALLPRRLLGAVSDFFGAPKTRTALRFMVNKNRRDMGNELIRISEIFSEMSLTMLQTTVGEKKLEGLRDAVIQDVCASCANREHCQKKGVLFEIKRLIECSLENDRANILNAAPLLSESCVNLVSLINYVNELLIKFEGLKKKNDTMNAAKTVVSSQLKGMSDILRELSRKQATPVRYAEELERKIMDDLTYRGVVAGEVWVREDGELTVVALRSSLKEDTVKRALNKLFKKDFLIKVEDSSMPGWSVITATPTPVYDVVFGSCNSCKSKDGCGDTHSFMRLSDGRFMAALCDGMGSGREAREFSSKTLSLIENFYRVGFEHGLVLSSVNNFFSLTGEETYGAMDIAVVDLNTLVTDIIKIGSPAVYVKNTEKLVKIEGSALPIGVLDEMKPSVRTVSLRPGDTVVMTSDGVSDCFEGDELASIINASSGLPKELVTSVIESAVNVKKVHSDDMTAVAFRIFKRE